MSKGKDLVTTLAKASYEDHPANGLTYYRLVKGGKTVGVFDTFRKALKAFEEHKGYIHEVFVANDEFRAVDEAREAHGVIW